MSKRSPSSPLPRARRAHERATNRDPLGAEATSDALIVLNLTPGLSREHVCLLAESTELWRAEPAVALPPKLAAAGIGEEQLAVARDLLRRGSDRATIERDRAAALGARIITRLDSDYPASLLHLDRPPPVLYVRGTLPATPAVAIVGPRNPDRWALRAATDLASALAAVGATIVSGFARGIDAAAHRAALDRPPGKTVAVLGCGLDVRYPREHHAMAAEIAEHGAVVTEFAIGRPPDRWSFPIRNRIIAALSAATVVVQAARRSGALITAREAAALGRVVLAVPGRPDDARSHGANRLLRDGAHVVLQPRDVLEALPLAERERLEALASNRDDLAGSNQTTRRPSSAAGLLELLAEERATDELARLAGLSVPELLSQLSQMEMDDLVERAERGWRARPTS